MSTDTPRKRRVVLQITPEQEQWLEAEASRLAISTSELARRLLDQARHQDTGAHACMVRSRASHPL